MSPLVEFQQPDSRPKKPAKQTSFGKARQYLTEEIWNKRLDQMTARERYNINFLRIITLSIRHFLENKCMLRASALTFYSLLSIVPVVALLLGIAKGFGMESRLKDQINLALSAAPSVAEQITGFANNQIAKTSGGVIAGVGILILFFTVIRMIGNIEESLNAIWNVKEQRPFIRKLSDYLSLVVISPIVLVMSSSITFFISQQQDFLFQKLPFLAFLDGPTQFLIRLIPIFLMMLLLTFIYAYLPNHKVRTKPALLGGIVAAIAFQLFQVAYLKFQGSMSTYNAIYGSLAALPLFMLYLQVSWSLLLFGAEVSYAAQNSSNLEFQGKIKSVSEMRRTEIALAVVTEAVRHFLVGEKGPCSFELSQKLHTPERFLNRILMELVQAGILSELATEIDGTVRFQPALDVNQLTVNLVISRLHHLGTHDIPLAESDSVTGIKQALQEIATTAESSPGNRLIKDLV